MLISERILYAEWCTDSGNLLEISSLFFPSGYTLKRADRTIHYLKKTSALKKKGKKNNKVYDARFDDFKKYCPNDN